MRHLSIFKLVPFALIGCTHLDSWGLREKCFSDRKHNALIEDLQCKSYLGSLGEFPNLSHQEQLIQLPSLINTITISVTNSEEFEMVQDAAFKIGYLESSAASALPALIRACGTAVGVHAIEEAIVEIGKPLESDRKSIANLAKDPNPKVAKCGNYAHLKS